MKQPEALRLAEIMSQKAKGKTNELGDHWSPVWCEKAAAELRRLHEANQAMLVALKWIADQTYDSWTNGAEAQRHAIAAITKGEQQ